MSKVIQLTRQVEVSDEVMEAARRHVWDELIAVHKKVVDASAKTMCESQAHALKQSSDIFLELYKETLRVR